MTLGVRNPVKPRSVTLALPALALLVLLSILIGAAATWSITRDRGVPQAVRGTITTVDIDASAIGFLPDGSDTAEGIGLASYVYWKDKDDSLHSHDPPCLRPLTHGQHVELGILELERTRDSHPAPMKIVVWVRCLGS